MWLGRGLNPSGSHPARLSLDQIYSVLESSILDFVTKKVYMCYNSNYLCIECCVCYVCCPPTIKFLLFQVQFVAFHYCACAKR